MAHVAVEKRRGDLKTGGLSGVGSGGTVEDSIQDLRCHIVTVSIASRKCRVGYFILESLNGGEFS